MHPFWAINTTVMVIHTLHSHLTIIPGTELPYIRWHSFLILHTDLYLTHWTRWYSTSENRYFINIKCWFYVWSLSYSTWLFIAHKAEILLNTFFVGNSAVTAVLDFVSALGRNTPHCSLPASNPEVVLLLYQPFFMPGYWPTFNISLLRFHSLPCPSLLSCHSSCIYSTRKQLLSVISVYRRWIRKTITSNMKKKAQLTPQTIKCNPCVLFPVCLNCMLLSPNCIRL